MQNSDSKTPTLLKNSNNKKRFILIGVVVFIVWSMIAVAMLVYSYPKLIEKMNEDGGEREQAQEVEIPYENDFAPTAEDQRISKLEQELASLREENEQLKNELATQKTNSTSKATSSSSTTVTQTPTPSTPKESCITYKIYEGDFKSEKCYTNKDYRDLTYYLSQYNSYAFQYNSASSTAEMTCDGSDFFKKSCEDAEDRMDEAEDKMGDYKSKIKAIIARGK